MLSRWIFFLIISISGLSALAEVTPYLWDSGQTAAPLLIFANDGEAPAIAAARYLKNITLDPEMKILFSYHWPEMALKGFQPLSQADLLESALLISNTPSDLTAQSQRVKGFQKNFQTSETKVFVLPLGIYSGLSSDTQKQIKDWIADKAPLLIAMGGADVDPVLYGQEKTLAKHTVLGRDLFESSLIQAYLNRSKGFLFSICRGHQLSSVSLGYQLYQDIPALLPKALSHADDEHEISIKKTTHSLLYQLFGESKVKVNSLHHQSVQFRSGGPLEISAMSEDGVIEALEMKNGHGLFVQFHPELMPNPIGRSILNQVVQQKRLYSPRACGRIH
jgi:putative glutamine amidotransferase